MDSLEYIDAYLKGDCTPGEARAFEERLGSDPAFAEEFAFFASAYQVMKEEQEQERKAAFRAIYEGAKATARGEMPPPRNMPSQGEMATGNMQSQGTMPPAGKIQPVIPPAGKIQPGMPPAGNMQSQGTMPPAGKIVPLRPVRRVWVAVAVAAVLLLALGLAWYFVERAPSTTRLADRYITQNLSSLSQEMGAADSMQRAISAYNNGNLSGALALFDRIIQTDPSNIRAMLDAGFVSLRMGDYDKALERFRQVETRTDPRFNDALFYEAITLMRRDRSQDAAHAKQILQEIVQKDLDKKEDARDLLGKF